MLNYILKDELKISLFQFDKYIEAFEDLILKGLKLEISNITLDINKTYITNWACAWNSPERQNKRCTVLAMCEKGALVKFEDGTILKSFKHFYRLEDLSPENYVYKKEELVLSKNK